MFPRVAALFVPRLRGVYFLLGSVKASKGTAGLLERVTQLLVSAKIRQEANRAAMDAVSCDALLVSGADQ